MILLWGVPGDGPLDAVQRHLLRYGTDVRLLDQRRAADSTVSLAVDGGRISGEVTWARLDQRVDIGEARAAYLRPSRPAARFLPPRRAMRPHSSGRFKPITP